MREIKYRAISECQGEGWLYGYPRHYCHNPHTEKWTIYDSYTRIETDVIPETIGQFTGLQDENGNEIYEGDIFVIGTHDGIISWHPNGYWCLHTSKDDINNHSYISLGELIEYAIREKYDYKVIGNIHEKL
jgi:hypothetical protein